MKKEDHDQKEKLKKSLEQTKMQIKSKWSQFSKKEVDEIADDFALLPSKLRKTYGFSDEQAKEESEDFIQSAGLESSTQVHKKESELIRKDYPNVDEMRNSQL